VAVKSSANYISASAVELISRDNAPRVRPRAGLAISRSLFPSRDRASNRASIRVSPIPLIDSLGFARSRSKMDGSASPRHVTRDIFARIFLRAFCVYRIPFEYCSLRSWYVSLQLSFPSRRKSLLSNRIIGTLGCIVSCNLSRYKGNALFRRSARIYVYTHTHTHRYVYMSPSSGGWAVFITTAKSKFSVKSFANLPSAASLFYTRRPPRDEPSPLFRPVAVLFSWRKLLFETPPRRGRSLTLDVLIYA